MCFIALYQLARMPHSDDISMPEIVAQTNGFSGAECVSVVREAALAALTVQQRATEPYCCCLIHGVGMEMARAALQPLRALPPPIQVQSVRGCSSSLTPSTPLPSP